jgi:hypothetical protein
MRPHLANPRGPCPRTCIVLFVLFALLLLDASIAHAASPLPAREYQAPPTTSVVVGWSWSGFYSSLESALGNRRRMIQVLIVLMCLGLYIMMRKAVDDRE